MTEKQYGILYDLCTEFPSVYPVELIENYMMEEFDSLTDEEFDMICLEIGDSSRWINGKWYIL